MKWGIKLKHIELERKRGFKNDREGGSVRAPLADRFLKR